MKNILAAAIMGALLLGAALAQSTSPTDPAAAQPPAPQTTPQSSQAPTAAPTQAPQTSQPATTPAPGAAGQPASSESTNPKRIAAGSVIPVQLTKTVDAKKAKTGDEVDAKVMQDMRSSSGQVLVAKDTKVIGHVTEAQPRSKEQKESQLGVAFDRAVTKDGQQMQMPMSIQAVIGQQNNQSAASTGGDQAGQGSSGAPTGTNAGAGRSPMGGASSQAPPSAPPSASDNGGGQQDPNAARPPINAQTQGVIGISNLQLQPANGNQGSVMTSEKNNVKLESGTMLLLKVNQ